MNRDLEDLRLLSIFHYALAGFGALLSFFPVLHLLMGIFMIKSPESFANTGGNPPPPLPFVGWLFVGMAAFMIILGLIMSVLIFLAGRNLKRRKNYILCLVVAALECLLFPFGTVLGVFTIIVLVRDSAKALFNPHAIASAD